jgi:protease I
MPNKKVLFVIASENFRDEEYENPKVVLESRGIEVKTASSQLGERKGTLGKVVAVDLTLNQVDMKEYDGIVFVGGAGAVEYFNDEIALKLVREFYRANKVIGAICIAPSILANAGILQGKNATAFPSEENNLRKRGVNYTGESTTVDGKIITARGPEAAEEFGEKIAEVLGI